MAAEARSAFRLQCFYRVEPEAVLNGIAWDDSRGRLFVTGKL
ncbi:MAG TPA: glutaminyl-peptide cyclotransferase [Acidobacteriota bacterium]|nr:glutaminyl-peptide cyclotransferase [Acidobacteriota bacterium]